MSLFTVVAAAARPKWLISNYQGNTMLAEGYAPEEVKTFEKSSSVDLHGVRFQVEYLKTGQHIEITSVFIGSGNGMMNVTEMAHAYTGMLEDLELKLLQ